MRVGLGGFMGGGLLAGAGGLFLVAFSHTRPFPATAIIAVGFLFLFGFFIGMGLVTISDNLWALRGFGSSEGGE